MENIPDWVIKLIEVDNLYCNKCKRTLRVDDLMSLGIQKSSLSPHNDKLCIGLSCPDCNDMTIFEIKEMSLIEFAFELLDKETEVATEEHEKRTNKSDILKDLSADKPSRRSSKSKKSKITKKEVNEIARFLKKTKTHEDFLVAMGLSPGQISKYNYKKDEKG